MILNFECNYIIVQFLIYPYWNVNLRNNVANKIKNKVSNLSILECKLLIRRSRVHTSQVSNLSILECKLFIFKSNNS